MSVPGGVSARPEALRRFREIGFDVGQGLRVRSSMLDSAAFVHEAGTEPDYQVRVGELAPAVVALATMLDDLGAWVGRVGDAFDAADTGSDGGVTETLGATFDRLFTAIPSGAVPGRALLGPATPVYGPHLPGQEPDPEPGLLDLLGDAGDSATTIEAALNLARAGGGAAAAAGRGTTAVTLLNARSFGSFVTWFGRVNTGFGALEAGAGRWRDDQELGLPTVERVGRTAAQAGIETGAGLLGGAVGVGTFHVWAAAAGIAGGPPGMAVAAVAIAGSYVGARIGGWAADELLDDEPEPLTPAEIGDAVGNPDPALIDDVLADIDEQVGVGGSAAATAAAWTNPATTGAGYDEAELIAPLPATAAPPAEPPPPAFSLPYDPSLVPSSGDD